MMGRHFPVQGYGYGVGPFDHGFGGPMVACIVAIVFVLIIGFIILAIIRHKRKIFACMSKPMNTKALEILAERYAKGEITDEEYAKMKEVLMKL